MADIVAVEIIRTADFYCHQSHSGRHRGAIRIAILPEGASAIVACPDIQCRARYYCEVRRADEHGELGTVQRRI